MVDNIETAYRLDAYDYDLPTRLIAQHPSEAREGSRLLVLDRARNSVAHRRFRDVVELLHPGDAVVVNDTRVVRARLRGVKETGGKVELLVLDPYKDPDRGSEEGYNCLIRTSKPARRGSVILLNGGPQAVVLTEPSDGKVRVRIVTNDPILHLLARIGEIPLPPYIQRDGKGQTSAADVRSYQTVYAARPGAVAAPTAGLHFSDGLLDTIRAMGVELISVTLHVGYGTFSPMRVSDIRDHVIHSEYAEVPAEAADRIRQAKEEGRRVVAVGTTVVRTLEWAAAQPGGFACTAGQCNHFIYPGHPFRVVDAMITNFHLPKSTLMLLVSAFAGREIILEAYRTAIREGYRFFSYGDAMFLL